MFSCEFCKISKNTFSYRTPPVAASWVCYCVKFIKIIKIAEWAKNFSYFSGNETSWDENLSSFGELFLNIKIYRWWLIINGQFITIFKIFVFTKTIYVKKISLLLYFWKIIFNFSKTFGSVDKISLPLLGVILAEFRLLSEKNNLNIFQNFLLSET